MSQAQHRHTIIATPDLIRETKQSIPGAAHTGDGSPRRANALRAMTVCGMALLSAGLSAPARAQGVPGSATLNSYYDNTVTEYNTTTGSVVFLTYGVGTHTGTTAYIMGIAADGSLIEITPGSLSASAKLNALTNADGAGALANGDHAQVWNWALDTDNKSAFTFGETTATDNTGTSIVKAATLATSTAIPLYVSNIGDGASFRVDDQGTDTSPFLIDANGNVSIGGTSAVSKFEVNGSARIQGAGNYLAFKDDGSLLDGNATFALILSNESSGNGQVSAYNHLFLKPINGNVGINTTGPDRKLDVLDASAAQLRLTHTDGTVYTDLQTDASGRLYVQPSGNVIRVGKSGDTTNNIISSYNNSGTVYGLGLFGSESTVSSFANNYGVNLGFSSGVNIELTSGSNEIVRMKNMFVPTSGTASLSQIAMTNTINQTGGASGITRGLYIAPTLTAAADWRAIETAAGQVKITDAYSAGSGSLAGSTLDIAPTWNTTGTPTAVKVNVTDTASHAASLLMDLQVGGSSKFKVSKAGATTLGGALQVGGNITSSTSFDIGTNGGQRVGGIYVSAHVNMANTGYYGFNGRSRIHGPTDGNLILKDDAGTSFGLLQFGGTTSSFPAIKRNGTGLDIRLADDSGYGDLTVGNLTVSGTMSGVSAKLNALTDADGAGATANGDHAQVWNWAVTTNNKSAMTFGETTNSTGTGTSIVKAATVASSNAIPLYVSNLGDGASFRVDDDASGTDTSPFVVAADGKVGIGTSNPSDLLHVYTLSGRNTTIGAGGVRAKHNNNGTTSPITLENTQVDYGVGVLFNLGYGGGSGSGGTAVAGGRIDVIPEQTWTATASTEDSSMNFKVALDGSLGEAMRISSGGNVGIGTTGPDRKLDVLDATNPQLRLTHTDGTVYSDFQTDSSGNLTISVAGGASTTGTFSSTGRTAYIVKGSDRSSIRMLATTGAGANDYANLNLKGDDGNVSLAVWDNSAGVFKQGFLYDYVADSFGIGTITPTTARLVLADTTLAGSGSLAGGVLDMTQTWNTTGTPTAVKVNVTDTASDAASNLMDLQVGAASKFKVDKTGALTTTASSILGGNVAVSGRVQVLTTSYYSWNNRSRMYSPADGSIRLTNDAATDFGLLQFGGTTSSFPALKRNGTGLDVRLADDSDYADLAVENLTVHGTITGSATSKLSGITAADGANTIASGDNAQVWNWAVTTNDKSAMTFGETTAATGTGTSVVKTATLASSLAIPLYVANLGDGTSFRVDDDVSGTDTTPFVIDAAGNVGIGTSSPTGIFDIATTYGARRTYWSSGIGTFIHNDNAVQAPLVLQNSQPGDGHGIGVLFKLGYGGTPTAAGTAVNAGRINVSADGTMTSTAGTQNSYMQFYTVNGGVLTEKMRITKDGSVGIGTASPGAQTHIVAGAAATKGLIVQGAASQSGNLTEWQDSAATNMMHVTAAGNIVQNATSNSITAGNVGGLNLRASILKIFGDTVAGVPAVDYLAGSSSYREGHRFRVSGVGVLGGGDSSIVKVTSTFNPTSGTDNHAHLWVVPTINQTGGANGITRGLYVQPTLTAAADWRAIETTGGALKMADTYLVSSAGSGGSLLDLTQTWNDAAKTPTAIKLNVTDTASNASSLLMDLQVGGSSKFNVTKGGAVTAASNIAAGQSGHLFWTGRTLMSSPASGDLLVRNNAGTDFGLLKFGGTTSSFPALKRNGTGLDVRLADDSDYADLTVGNLTVTGTMSGVSAKLNALTDADGAGATANGDHAQVWNWALDTDNKSAMTFGETTATDNTGTSILKAATLATSTAIPLYVSNLGAGASFRVDDVASDTSPFVIAADGKVGIGTSSPTVYLHVKTNDLKKAFFSQLTTGTDAALRIDSDSTSAIIYGRQSDDSGYKPLYLKASAINSIVIDTTGNVGIGTTGPDRKLDVLDASNPQMRLTYTDGSVYTDFLTDSGGDLNITPSGNDVTIGTPASNIGNLNTWYISFFSNVSGGTINGASGLVYVSSHANGHTFQPQNTTAATTTINISNPPVSGAITSTAGASIGLQNSATFAPTSGTATRAYENIAPIINQTGGANGITRGIYIAPTLTAAADWRAIEMSNNAGFGIYQSGASAANYFAGATGIGTTAPSSLLDLQKAGTATANTDIFEITNSGNAAAMTDTRNSILFNQYYYHATTPAVATAARITTGTEGNWTSTLGTQDSYLAFQTALNGTVAEKMRINSDGNVGINTTGPDRKLDILDDTNPQLRLSQADGTAYTDFSTNSSGYLRISPSGANVGIGTSTPDELLTLFATNARLRVFSGNNAAIYVESYNASPNASIQLKNSLGGVGTPAIMTNGKSLGVIQFQGHTGAAFQSGALIQAVAAEDWSEPGSKKTRLDFKVMNAAGAAVPTAMSILTPGNVGIGTLTPGVALHIASASDTDILRLEDSDGTCNHNPESGAETVTCSSDIRLKKDIVPAAPVLDYFDKFVIKDYTVKVSGSHMTGVIAQELQQVYPDLVHEADDGMLQVEQPNPWKLVKAAQELRAENETLRADLRALKAQVDLLARAATSSAPDKGGFSPWMLLAILAGAGGLGLGAGAAVRRR